MSKENLVYFYEEMSSRERRSDFCTKNGFGCVVVPNSFTQYYQDKYLRKMIHDEVLEIGYRAFNESFSFENVHMDFIDLFVSEHSLEEVVGFAMDKSAGFFCPFDGDYFLIMGIKEKMESIFGSFMHSFNFFVEFVTQPGSAKGETSYYIRKWEENAIPW